MAQTSFTLNTTITYVDVCIRVACPNTKSSIHCAIAFAALSNMVIAKLVTNIGSAGTHKDTDTDPVNVDTYTDSYVFSNLFGDGRAARTLHHHLYVFSQILKIR